MTAPDPTTMGILASSIAGLIGAIGVLWKHIASHFARIENKLQDCEDDRENLWRAIAANAGQPVDEIRQKGRNSK